MALRFIYGRSEITSTDYTDYYEQFQVIMERPILILHYTGCRAP